MSELRDPAGVDPAHARQPLQNGRRAAIVRGWRSPRPRRPHCRLRELRRHRRRLSGRSNAGLARRVHPPRLRRHASPLSAASHHRRSRTHAARLARAGRASRGSAHGRRGVCGRDRTRVRARPFGTRHDDGAGLRGAFRISDARAVRSLPGRGTAHCVRTGAVGSPASPGTAPGTAGVPIDDSAALIRGFHRQGRLLYAVTPRFALSASEAMLEVCQSLLRDHPGVRFTTHLNENAQEIAEVARLFPWAARLPVGLRTVRSRRPWRGDGAQCLDHGRRTGEAGRPRHVGRTLSVQQCRARQRHLSVAASSRRRRPCRARDRCRRRHRLRHAQGSTAGVLHAADRERGRHRSARPTCCTSPPGPAPRRLALDDEVGDFGAGKAADLVLLRPP